MLLKHIACSIYPCSIWGNLFPILLIIRMRSYGNYMENNCYHIEVVTSKFHETNLKIIIVSHHYAFWALWNDFTRTSMHQLQRNLNWFTLNVTKIQQKHSYILFVYEYEYRVCFGKCENVEISKINPYNDCVIKYFERKMH